MSDSFYKKENLKKKAEKKKEKALKNLERKTQNNKGKSLESMFAYVDEFGVITTTPPEQRKKTEIDLESIQLGAKPIEKEDPVKQGVVSFQSEKGYGFIQEDKTSNKLFYHINDLIDEVKLQDKVSFEIKRTSRGDNAIHIKKIQ